MKRQPWILAGTALGLFMASAPLSASPLRIIVANDSAHLPGLVLAQANCAEGESAENCAQQAAPAEQEQKPRRKKDRQPAAAEEAAPAPEQQQEAAPVEPEQKPRRKKDREKAKQPAATEEAAPAPEQQQEAAPAEPEQKPRRKKDREKAKQPAATEEAAPAAEPQQQAAPAEPEQQAAPAEPEQKPDRKKNREKAKQPAATEEAAPAAEPQQEAAPTEPEQKPDRKKNREKAKQPAAAEEAAPAAEPQQPPAPAGQQSEAPADPDAAPILDSQKDQRRRDRDGNRKRDKQQNGQQQDEAGGKGTPPPAAVDPGPPPANDKAAQQAIRPEKIEPVTEEKGKRREKAPDHRRGERREGIDVLKEIGDRVIIQLGGQTMVESTDRSRLTHGARDVYYEDLPRGRTRETIERGNGDRVVTIRNRNGDIIQRSRITRDGREYVLNYVDERRYDDEREWRDPGDDLPPMRLHIPRNQYILDSESVEDPDDYYEFLEQPPVEKVQRLYSVQEVKRSARVRDIARRIDLDTLTFEFGSASISDSEVQKLEGVANAMERLLNKNPAETFLIEGHTDAVGTEDANLALSDRRAEAVAEALTNVFGIPPENLSTQGYGEEYLKVNTTAPERQNRRVAIRRITSLVAPVASAE